MILVKGLEAHLLQRKEFEYVEDMMIEGYTAVIEKAIPFTYNDIVVTKKRVNNNGIKKLEITRVLETNYNLDFKADDLIILKGDERYSVDYVDEKLDERYKTVVRVSPHLKDRYMIKQVFLK